MSLKQDVEIRIRLINGKATPGCITVDDDKYTVGVSVGKENTKVLIYPIELLRSENITDIRESFKFEFDSGLFNTGNE